MLVSVLSPLSLSVRQHGEPPRSKANAPRRYVSLVSRSGTEGLADLQALYGTEKAVLPEVMAIYELELVIDGVQ